MTDAEKLRALADRLGVEADAGLGYAIAALHRIADDLESAHAKLSRWGGDTIAQKLENALCEIRTVQDCKGCGTLHRPRDMRGGLCINCIAAERDELRATLDAIP